MLSLFITLFTTLERLR